jgi:hypothetical protein
MAFHVHLICRNSGPGGRPSRLRHFCITETVRRNPVEEGPTRGKAPIHGPARGFMTRVNKPMYNINILYIFVNNQFIPDGIGIAELDGRFSTSRLGNS